MSTKNRNENLSWKAGTSYCIWFSYSTNNPIDIGGVTSLVYAAAIIFNCETSLLLALPGLWLVGQFYGNDNQLEFDSSIGPKASTEKLSFMTYARPSVSRAE